MNFLNMEYFMEVVSEQSITKAAERLGVSQQAVSNQISRLEEELGCALFERYQNLTLTYAGKQFYRYSIKMLDTKHQLEGELSDIADNRKGELRIGISFSRGQAILPLVLPNFSKQYPYVELRVTEGSTQVLEDRLNKGLIDVMIGYAPFMCECAETFPIMQDKLYLTIPNILLRDKFGNNTDKVIWDFRQSGNLSLFKDLPFVLLKTGDRIRTLVDHEFKKVGMSPFIKLETESIQTAYFLSTEGMGLSFMPKLYLESPYINAQKSTVTCIPCFQNRSPDIIAIGYNKERYVSKVARDFIGLCQQTLYLEQKNE